MKKIESITEYPFISHMMDWRMDFDNDYIYIGAEEEAYKKLKAAINELTYDPEKLFEISELIGCVATENENVGFLNGYLTVVEIMQGKVKWGVYFNNSLLSYNRTIKRVIPHTS